MATEVSFPPPKPTFSLFWVFPAVCLAIAYSVLGLTFTQHPTHAMVMQRCVLVNPNLSRIWSVAHIEIGLAYLGVFGGMTVYLIRASRTDRTHLSDLGLGLTYLLASFLLDFACVRYFQPFQALLVGDAIVMTFTLLVSRQLWFQRLLGVFVPLVFFTCSLGHFMEGLSYWRLTYPVNVPWTMVTADIGFAILVNAVRFPAFIRGHDLVNEMDQLRLDARQRSGFYRDVLRAVTEGRLNLCVDEADLPARLPVCESVPSLTMATLSQSRRLCVEVAKAQGFTQDRYDTVQIAVGEAAMNAIVHGGLASLEVCAQNDTLQVWVRDKGPGIQMANLPRATLERGFSTKDSLGHGFWMMLRSADRLDLLTGSTGTTLVLSFAREVVNTVEAWTPLGL